ncbi:MAG: hypothetical protein ACKOE7_11960, partial [Actinomycetota bacterium]
YGQFPGRGIVRRLWGVNPNEPLDPNGSAPAVASDAPEPNEPAVSDDAHMVRRAAQRFGTVGAMLAGGMVVFDRLLGRKPKEEPAVVIEAATEPEDIEKGISLRLEQPDGEQLHVFAPPPGRRRARAVRRRRQEPNE